MLFGFGCIHSKTLNSVLCGLLLSLTGSLLAETHTVKSGDTLYRIATDNGMTVDQLRQMNGLGSKANLTVGQALTVSDGAGRAEVPAKADTKANIKANAGKPIIKETLSAETGKKTTRKKVSGTRLLGSGSSHRKRVAEPVPQSPKTVSSKGALQLASSSAIVVDATTGQPLISKNSSEVKSIASITKLMTAMVVLDANPPMNEILTISDADVDHLKSTSSRLPVGTRLSRYELLRLALMSSENRASSALSRHYQGGKPAFINAMNNKAAKLGMAQTHFEDSTGLTPHNVSTAEDLVKMVQAASLYSLIQEFTTTPGREVALRPNSTPLQYKNSNVLVREASEGWDIRVSKTGYTQEAGRCLVMMAMVANRPAVMVFLESEGKLSPVGDANRIKEWIESGKAGVTLAAR